MLRNTRAVTSRQLWLVSLFAVYLGLFAFGCKTATTANTASLAANEKPALAGENTPARTTPPPATVNNHLYGGIEIGGKGVKSTVIKVEGTADGYAGEAVMPMKTVNTTIMSGVAQTGKFTPAAMEETVAEIQKIYQKMTGEFQVAPERIFVIASSGLRKPDKADVDNKEELIQKVDKAVGEKLEFLSSEDEVTFSIVGVVPIQDRRRALLMDIGSGSTKGGYREGTKEEPRFVTASIPYGTVSFTDEVSKQAPEEDTFSQEAEKLRNTLILPTLRQELGRKPGFMNRRKVYLSGGIVWAMANLMYPTNREALVHFRPQDIEMFAYRAKKDPEALLAPNLSGIKDEKARQAIEDELQRVGETFTPKNLVAGAELLRAVSRACRLSKKQLYFTRLASMGWLLKYVEYQAQEN